MQEALHADMGRVEKTVFISYRRSNAPWALAIFQNLRQHGYDVFFDYQGIASGDFERVILENITARAHFLVLLTPSALERCDEPGDWLRREIETALDTRRNIVPLMLESFDFDTPAIASQLTGKLATLKRYNALRVPVEFFMEAMDRLREKHLNLPLDAVLHPASSSAQQAARDEQAAAGATPAVQEKELMAQQWFEQGFNAADIAEKLRYYNQAIRLKPDYADLEIKGVTQRFRWIAPGAFLMGSPEDEPERYSNETQHRVTLTQGYWLADSTCTQALWRAVMGSNPSRFQDDEQNPVEQVSWNDVQQFIDKLNGLIPNLNARLPTEAQWEYACRAGTTTPFSFGKNITPEQVNYDGNYPYAGGKAGLYREKTVPVKSLPPNPWGLYEMHGNVWEWCNDWFGDYPSAPVIDPVGLSTGVYRVLRGGSWSLNGRRVRSAYRDRDEPVNCYYDIGFRLSLGQGASTRQGKQESRSTRVRRAAGGARKRR
jgi:formylglycine-generating enzyme required for sulfatase activity